MNMLLKAALGLSVLVGGATTLQAQGFETPARAAYVYDMATHTVLLDKNADEPLPPASMSKLMTAYLAFEAIADGRLQSTDRLGVSEHCMTYKGSSMFLNTRDRVTVDDLLRGVIILSGNDASCVLAEAISPDGTEAGFARRMTDRARELGMTQSSFANSNGWPAAGQRMSMRDLGILAQHIIEDYPTFYPLFAEREFTFDGRVPSNSQNRNPILALGNGADGLKTGHTSEAGYGLVGSAKQGDRRVIFVITGLDTEAARRDESERIMNWAFRQFSLFDMGKAGDVIPGVEPKVWMGANATVRLALKDDLQVIARNDSSDDLTSEVVYNSPISAPIKAGDEIATLVLKREGMEDVRLPLVAESDVAQGGFTSRLQTAAQIIVKKLGIGQDA